MNAKSFTTQLSVLWSRARKAAGFARTYGLSSLKARYVGQREYQKWIVAHDTLTDSARQEVVKELEMLGYQPLISVVVPVYDVAERYLREAIESVRGQLYQNWELCLVDDCSSNVSLREVIESYARIDTRIRYQLLPSNSGISEATNAAVAFARGEYVGLLDHDDLLREQTLSAVACELNRYPDAELVFTDEDRLSQSGQRCKPYFKAGWNPELMLSHNAVCHFMVIRSSTFRELGGMRTVCNGAQDWDLALRVGEQVGPEKIRHIPQVLYHWRESPDSTALNLNAKPYVRDAQQRTLSEHLARRGEGEAKLEALPYTSMWRPRFFVSTPLPKISVVVPKHVLVHAPLAARWLGRLAKEYPSVEVIVAGLDGDTSELEEFTGRDVSHPPNCESPRNINYASIFNLGASIASGEFLCFISGEITRANPSWLAELVGQALRADVGAVGPVILSEHGTVQSAGLTLCHGEVQALFRGVQARSLGTMCRLAVARDVSALSAACLMVRRAAFEQVRGFDPKQFSGALYDVDLCLKLRAHYYRLISTPLAQVEVRSEPETIDMRTLEEAKKQWPEFFERDPLWNPNLLANGSLRGTLSQ